MENHEHPSASRKNDGLPIIRCSGPTRHTNILECMKVSSKSGEYHGHEVCCGKSLRTGVFDNIEEHRGILIGWRGMC